MKDLSVVLKNAIAKLGGDSSKLLAIAKNNLAYKNAIKTIWKDEQSHKFILHNTNALYVREDTRPRKGPNKDKPVYVVDVAIGDPVVRSEIDTHRELIQLQMMMSGMNFDSINIIASKGNMKNRHPFG